MVVGAVGERPSDESLCSFATPTDSFLHLFGAGEKIAATRCEYFNCIVFELRFNHVEIEISMQNGANFYF
jgi:hypothetical protein